MKYFPLFFLIVIYSCDYFQPREKPQALARVGEKYLEESELLNLGLEGVSSEDSTKIVDAYINNWIRREAYLRHARIELSENQLAELRQKVDDYEESLYTHLYEEQMLRERLDTIIEESELEAYYQENQEDFVINEPILKFVSIKRDQPFKNSSEINQWFEQMIDEGNDVEIKEYCTYNAISCSLNSENWVPQKLFFETINADASKNNIALQENRLFEIEQGQYYFLYKILDRQTTGYYPLSFVREEIKKVILYKREKEFLETLRNRIFEKVKENNEIEVYDNE